jgi:hypothetical protein
VSKIGSGILPYNIGKTLIFSYILRLHSGLSRDEKHDAENETTYRLEYLRARVVCVPYSWVNNERISENHKERTYLSLLHEGKLIFLQLYTEGPELKDIQDVEKSAHQFAPLASWLCE